MDAILAKLALLLTGQWQDLASRIEAVDWSFAAGGAPLLAAGVAVAAAIAGLCYLRTTEGLRPRLRLALGVLRFVAVVCLLLIAAGTVCRVHVVRRAKPGLVVLVDDSPSMELAQGGQSRLALAEAALQPGGGLARLRRDYDVQVLRSSAVLDQARDLPQDLAAAVVRASTTILDVAYGPAQAKEYEYCMELKYQFG